MPKIAECSELAKHYNYFEFAAGCSMCYILPNLPNLLSELETAWSALNLPAVRMKLGNGAMGQFVVRHGGMCT